MEKPDTTDKILTAIAHLGFLSGVGYFFAPLIIYLLKKDSPFVAAHAKQAMVWQGACFVLSAVLGIGGFVLTFLTAGLGALIFIPGMALLGLLLLIPSIIATVKAFGEEEYMYPVCGNWASNF